MQHSAKTIKQFLRLKSRFESRIKKQVVDRIYEELSVAKNVNPDEIRELITAFNNEYKSIKRTVLKIQKAGAKDKKAVVGDDEAKEEEKEACIGIPEAKQNELKQKQVDQQMREFSTFTMKELKYNLPMTTTLKDRANILKEIICLSRSQNISLTEAKQKIYQSKSIYIVQIVDPDVNRTDTNNMHEEREYNEYIGAPVYGWTEEGDALYEPTLGSLVVAPEYRYAGFEWRNVLEERWLQRSWVDEGESLETYRGN